MINDAKMQIIKNYLKIWIDHNLLITAQPLITPKSLAIPP